MSSKIIFWEKWALQPEDPKDDLVRCFKIKEDPKIREVLREFESKNILKILDFDDVNPQNSSVKKWILKIFNSYPDVDENLIDDLINTFRFSLYPRSKKRYDYIVGILLLYDTLVLLHSKKMISLVESDERIFPAEEILSAKNVLRAAVIKDEDGKKVFSAFEHNRRWSRGHADFWQIRPDDVNWEALGTFVLYIDMEGFDLPIALPLDPEHLDKLAETSVLTATGKIRLGRAEGKVTKVKVLRKIMDFSEFYEFYMLRKENLSEHQNLFSRIIPETTQLDFDSTFNPSEEYHEFVEDFAALMRYSVEGEALIIRKKHPRYSICYFTRSYPRIKPKYQMIYSIYQAIFENRRLELWHAGEQLSEDPVVLGSLMIYNDLAFSPQSLEFGTNLLNVIQDLRSRKERSILQYLLCEYWKNSSPCNHFPIIFDHIIQTILMKDLQHEFNTEVISATEQYVEYKSPADVDLKIKRFVEQTLVPTIKSYVKNGDQARYAILYGVEDNGAIRPIYRLKSDMVADIQNRANEILNGDGVRIRALSIPFNDEVILLVLLIPAYEGN